MSWRELNHAVARLHHAFAKAGLKPGDRVAAIVPNMPETIVAFLAVTSLGGVWSSCSPDFGERGILDRFGQIKPRFLIACDGYYYNGKTIPIANKVAAVLKELPSVEETVIIDYIGTATDISRTMPRAVAYGDYISRRQLEPINFAQLPFDHPLYILYSSGTTGIPKCIVHSAGGALLKHLCELLLNSDVKSNDRLFYFTTCGWMMWNWLVSGLATGATLLLYDGSPFTPSARVLFDYADEERMTLFGTSAKYIDAVRKSGLKPRETHRLGPCGPCSRPARRLRCGELRLRLSAIKSDMHLASISGGTDICGCFVGGNPLSPVWRGEIQGPMLGMAVDVYDDHARHMLGEKGELVCTKPFPSMPVMFWNDRERREIFQCLFRALSQHLVPWRFRGMDAPWRHHYPRPLRCDAQSGRRTHRHGRNLCAGRAHS